jgi:uncharacterized membrane protein YedE/YeeE
MNLTSEKDIRHTDAICVNESNLTHNWYHNIKYLIVGIGFGIIFVKAEIISWFRIQEMFRFQSFHMFGIIGSAILVGMISIFLIKKFNIKTIYGEEIKIPTKEFNKGQIYGGLIFGFGWAITGACPGPLFAQIGAGSIVIIVTLISAILGTWIYGKFRDYLPH